MLTSIALLHSTLNFFIIAFLFFRFVLNNYFHLTFNYTAVMINERSETVLKNVSVFKLLHILHLCKVYCI